MKLVFKSLAEACTGRDIYLSSDEFEGLSRIGSCNKARLGEYGAVLTVKGGTKVYMETIETLSGRTCTPCVLDHERRDHQKTDGQSSHLSLTFCRRIMLPCALVKDGLKLWVVPMGS